MLTYCSGLVFFIDNRLVIAPITVVVFYPLTQVGKRRGGVFLKTGVVAKKQRNVTEVSENVFLFCLFFSPE